MEAEETIKSLRNLRSVFKEFYDLETNLEFIPLDTLKTILMVEN